MTAKIILADDHSVVRLGIKTIVDRLNDVQVLGEVTNGEDALKMIIKLKPDITLLDISMPKLNGLEVAKKVKELGLNTKTLILSNYDKEEYVLQSIEYGCNGYLMKNAEPEELESAIKALINGGNYYGSNISKIMMNNLLQKKKQATLIDKKKLTRREIEIIKLVVDGHTTKEVADKLFISARTIESHKTNIYHKLGINNSIQLIKYATKHIL